MTNRFTAPPPDQIILAKLRVLLQSVNDIYKEGGVALDDELINAYNEAMQLFLDSIDGSIVGVTFPIIPGAPPDPVDYNVFTTAVSRDLEAMFLEVGAVDRLVSSNFNTLTSLKDHLLTIARRISLKIGDYLLYVDPSLGNGFFFGDSFNSSTYIDVGSDLLDSDECLLSQEEGIVLLPLDGDPTRATIEKFVINDNSNGVSGNNQQLDVLPHDDINALGDGEPDSWYEYERVSVTAASSPLLFDLTIVLSEPTIINHVHISPVFFGTPTPVKIVNMETSADGKEYQSIMDEIPISDFLSEEEDDVFVLSGKSSKYYGEGKFSFLPRRAKFVHIVLEQHTAYSIITNNGTRLRYAIGLKDINILSRKFKTDGEIVSTPIEISGDATKISIWASENPTQTSSLANIIHEVTTDDGATWLSLQPQNRDEVLYPEVLNFNNADPESFSTSSEINSVRHRIVMTRDPEAFVGAVTLKSERLSMIDIAPIPGFSPFSVSLQKSPIVESVSVYIPTLGSVSCPLSRRGDGVVHSSPPMDLDSVQFTIDNDSTDTVRFKLPWSDILHLDHKIRVFVNGEQWEYSSKSANDIDGMTQDDRVYFLNLGGRELQFVHVVGATKYGKLPGSGARIEVFLDGDNPSMTRGATGYTLTLLGPTDGFKDNVSIVTPTELFPEEGTEAAGTWEEVNIPKMTRTFNVNEKLSLSEFEVDYNAAVKISAAPWASRKTFIATSKLKQKAVVSNPSQEYEEVALSNVNKMGNNKGASLTGEIRALPTVVEGEPLLPEYSSASSTGMLLPVFDTTYNTGFQLIEYAKGSSQPLNTTSSLRVFTGTGDPDLGSGVEADGYVEFVDGFSEFTDSNGAYQTKRWTFDPYSGIVYFAGFARTEEQKQHRIVFRFRRRKFRILNPAEWDFERNITTGKINTSRVVLSSTSVRQFEITSDIEGDSVAVPLVEEAAAAVEPSVQTHKGHNWWKKRIVKGSIRFGNPDNVLNGIQPVEVSFIDGQTELQNAVSTKYLISAQSGAGTKTITLPGIDSDHPLIEDVLFDPIPVYPDPVHTSQFVTKVELLTPTAGEYTIDDATGVVQVVIPTGDSLLPHMAIYRYEDQTSGVNKLGLFSVNYEEGTLHFNESATVNEDTVTCNVTMYSAFYNMGEIVSEGNIQKIDAAGKTVEMRPEYGLRFLADDSPSTPRPRFVRVGYEYYNETTESLKDLEPYFSPICKDLAIRAITKDMIGDI